MCKQALKHFERDNKIEKVRRMMATLKEYPVAKTWKVLLEAAGFEARTGNVETARSIFNFLLQDSGVKPGPIYYEAARFEERIGEQQRAVKFIQAGIVESPRYGESLDQLFLLSACGNLCMHFNFQINVLVYTGPLWFLAFRIWERLETRRPTDQNGLSVTKTVSPFDVPPTILEDSEDECLQRNVPHAAPRIHFNLKNTRWMLRLALAQVQRELLWKVYFAQGQLEERQAVAAQQLSHEVSEDSPVEV